MQHISISEAASLLEVKEDWLRTHGEDLGLSITFTPGRHRRYVAKEIIAVKNKMVRVRDTRMHNDIYLEIGGQQ